MIPVIKPRKEWLWDRLKELNKAAVECVDAKQDIPGSILHEIEQVARDLRTKHPPGAPLTGTDYSK